MGAHQPINIVTVPPNLVQKARCKSTLSIFAINYKLSDPTNTSIAIIPTHRKHVTSEIIVNGSSNI